MKSMRNMNKMTVRYFRLFLGLFLCAIGIVMTINANLGYAPWDVFHQGIGNIIGIKIGTANILTGIVIVGIEVMMGQRPGIGTLCNMSLIGVFMNIIMTNNLIPILYNVIARIIMIFIGMIIMGIGSYLYIGSGFGAGPRDGFMILLLKKTNKSVRFIRNSIEITALIVGYFLGGPIGIGTIIMSFGLGPSVQLVFNMFNFDAKEVKHRQLGDEFKSLKNLIKR